MNLALVLTDVRLFGEALARSLDADGSVRVVGTVSSVEDARARIADVGPDVVLVDVALHDSLAAIYKLAKVEGGSRVVALAVPDSEHDVIACAEAGACGFVPAGATLKQLTTAVAGAAHGETVVSPRIAGAMVRHIAANAEHRPEPPLTAREMQILELIEQGLRNKEIARALSIEVSTVKNHVHNVIDKLGASGRYDAVARVRRFMPRGGRGFEVWLESRVF